MGTRTCRFARETETERAIEISTFGMGRLGSGAGSSVSRVSTSANGMRVDSDGDTPDLGPVDADDGDMIRSILDWVAFNAEGELRDVLDSVSLEGGCGRPSVLTLRCGRTESLVLWLDVVLGCCVVLCCGEETWGCLSMARGSESFLGCG
jgi:hypothetical protein